MAAPARTLAAPLKLALFSVMGLIACATPAGATTVTVPGDFPTVQAAVNHLDGESGGTILVSPTIPPEQIFLSNLVNIIGLLDAHGVRPRLLGATIYGGDAYHLISLRNLHFTEPIYSLAFVEFADCELDARVTSNDSDSQTLRFVRCTLRGQPAVSAVWIVEIDSCLIYGGVHVTTAGSGTLDLRNSTLVGPGGWGVYCEPSSYCHVANNTITGFDNGVSSGTRDGVTSVILGNRITDCPGFGIQVVDGLVAENDVRNCGVGIAVDDLPAEVRSNVVLDSHQDGMRLRGTVLARDNVIGRSGRYGVYVERDADTDGFVDNNTCYSSAASGFMIQDPTDDNVTRVSHNIAYGNGGYGLLSNGQQFTATSCNDWFANTLGATSGMSPGATDLAIDPDFCNLIEDDAHLIAGSPLLDAVGCGLIGALGQGCTTTATLDTRLVAERLLEGVRLRWQWAAVATEVALERTELLAGPWGMITADVSRDANATIALDRDALPDREYWYRLRSLDRGEWRTLGEPLFVAAAPTSGFALLGVIPNPGPGPIRVTFSLPRAASIDLDVFDVQGRHVATLARGTHTAGAHTAEWSGVASASPSTGIYLARYRFPGGQRVLRFVRHR